jgi:hypothetical protein
LTAPLVDFACASAMPIVYRYCKIGAIAIAKPTRKSVRISPLRLSTPLHNVGIMNLIVL